MNQLATVNCDTYSGKLCCCLFSGVVSIHGLHFKGDILQTRHNENLSTVVIFFWIDMLKHLNKE